MAGPGEKGAQLAGKGEAGCGGVGVAGRWGLQSFGPHSALAIAAWGEGGGQLCSRVLDVGLEGWGGPVGVGQAA